jgi:glycosyltransferase involved in cell wall biosynthesis
VLKLLMHESVPALIEVMQSKGERVIIDIDDFHFGLDPENVAYHATNPHVNPESNRAFYEIGIRKADTVTVSTDFLADFYSGRVRDVRLIRNGIDAERFTPVAQPQMPTFGWVGATWWRSGDIEILSEWLPGFVKDHGVPVQHAGHIPNDPRHFAVRAGLRRVQTKLMTTISDYPRLLSGFHVGLVPLTRKPFNEAKSFLKGLEYAAAGIPFIATPTEEYRILYESGVGRLADSPDEWRDHAMELLDPDIRRAEAERQRAIVEKIWHVKERGPEWAIALHG